MATVFLRRLRLHFKFRNGTAIRRQDYVPELRRSGSVEAPRRQLSRAALFPEGSFLTMTKMENNINPNFDTEECDYKTFFSPLVGWSIIQILKTRPV